MSYYVYNPDKPYADYLQTELQKNDIENTICMQLQKSTRDKIGNEQELHENHMQVLENIGGMLNTTLTSGFEELSDQISRGFEYLAYGLEGIDRKLSKIDGTLEQGFDALDNRLGTLNQVMENILYQGSIDVEIKAFNHYSIARDNFRKGLFVEAVNRLDKAINGVTGVSDGYPEEWRFHHLLGLILLGKPGFENELIDLPKSEEEFLKAVKYSISDNPLGAATAYMSACYSAYCMGETERAKKYLMKAVELDNKLAEAFFLLSKVQMYLGNQDKAFPVLASALDLNVKYALQAGEVGSEFQSCSEQLNQFFDSYTTDKFTRLHEEMEEYKKNILRLQIIKPYVMKSYRIKLCLAAQKQGKNGKT